jgi:hypothetical protein
MQRKKKRCLGYRVPFDPAQLIAVAELRRHRLLEQDHACEAVGMGATIASLAPGLAAMKVTSQRLRNTTDRRALKLR